MRIDKIQERLEETQHQLHCLKNPWEDDNITHLHEEYQLAVLVPRLKQDMHSINPGMINRLKCKNRFLTFFWYPVDKD